MVEPAPLLAALHAAADAIAESLGVVDDWGLAGTKAGQHHSDLAADAAGLAVLDLIAKPQAHLAWLFLGQDRNPVVRFLPVKDRGVAGIPQGRSGKLFVSALRFLKTNNVRTGLAQPGQQPLLALAQRVDIPGRDLQASASYSSISTPGGGTMTSLSGRFAAAAARTHSTAGTSPCTSTTFFGATCLMYARIDSREACALN